MTTDALGWTRWVSKEPTRFGQDVSAPDATADQGGFTVDDVRSGLRKITPTLLLVGIATGAAFAIGSGLVAHYLFPPRRRRR